MKIKRPLKLIRRSAALLFLSALNLSLSTLFAQPTLVDYQGQLDVSGNPANGNYDMTFTFYVGPTGGTALAGPITVNPVAVNNGLFTAYFTVSPGIFAPTGAAGARFVEIAVRPSGSTAAYTVLTPRQPLAQTPYAIAAQTAASADSVIANSVTAAGIAAGQVVKSLNGLEDAVTLVAGSNVTITPIANTITIDSTGGGGGGGNCWSLTGNAGTSPGTNFLGTTDNQPLQLRAWDFTGLTLQYAFSPIGSTVLSYGMNVIGGYWGNTTLNNAWGATISGGGDFESSFLGSFSYPNTVVGALGTVSGGAGNTAGIAATVAGGRDNVATGIASFAAGEHARATHSGSFVWSDGSQTAGFNSSRQNSFSVLATGGVLFDLGSTTVAIGNSSWAELGVQCANERAILSLHSTITPAGQPTVDRIWTLESGLYGTPGLFGIYDRTAGQDRMTIDTVGNTYFGGPNVSVCTLTIRGGCDLAEPFQISSAPESEISEGSVLVIDEQNPGRLKLSEEPYDTRVAGVVSGANGVSPGIQMHQEGLLEGGRNVALSGRVYVMADASNGQIKPGDLLTTSSTPGHAMKVTDHAKAQGAILGKAMTSLKNGKGGVLVLVSLQ